MPHVRWSLLSLLTFVACAPPAPPDAGQDAAQPFEELLPDEIIQLCAPS